MLEIIKDGFANLVHQRILPRTASFPPINRKQFPTPIEIFQSKSGDFATAQAVNGKKQDHRSCAIVGGFSALSIFHQPLHVIPSWSVRQAILLVCARFLDLHSNTRLAPPPELCMAEDCAQRLRSSGYGPTIRTGLALPG